MLQEKELREETKLAEERWRNLGFLQDWSLEELLIIGGDASEKKIEWPNFPCLLTPIFIIRDKPDWNVLAYYEKQNGKIVGRTQKLKKLLAGFIDGNVALFKRSVIPRPNCELWVLNILETGEAMYGTKEKIEKRNGEKIEIDTQFMKFTRQCFEEAEAEYERSPGLTAIKIWISLLMVPLYSFRQYLPRFLQKKDFSLGSVERKILKEAKQRIKSLR